ncbi:MAG: hypothetical protein ACYDCQ_22885 [Dehalococcoidia bacterium]
MDPLLPRTFTVARFVIQDRFGSVPGFMTAPYPLMRAGVHLPGITSDFQYIDFLLDTGATVTTVAAITALTPLGVPVEWFAQLTGVIAPEPVGGVGGL